MSHPYDAASASHDAPGSAAEIVWHDQSDSSATPRWQGPSAFGNPVEPAPAPKPERRPTMGQAFAGWGAQADEHDAAPQDFAGPSQPVDPQEDRGSLDQDRSGFEHDRSGFGAQGRSFGQSPMRDLDDQPRREFAEPNSWHGDERPRHDFDDQDSDGGFDGGVQHQQPSQVGAEQREPYLQPGEQQTVVTPTPAQASEDQAQSDALTIGRSRDNSIPLDDMLVSRHHARIVAGEEGPVIEDLGSRNGTFVNGRQIDREPLHEGDRIGIGSTVFVIRDGNLDFV